MVDLEYPLALIDIVKAKNITHFKMAGLEFRIGDDKVIERDPAPLPAVNIESTMPPDLRADDTMNYDKILNWSGSPDPQDGQLPLTGEEDAQV